MKSTEVVININTNNVNNEKQVDTLQLWLGAMRFNGQILGFHQVISRKKDCYCIYSNIPEADSLDAKHANIHVEKCYKNILSSGMEIYQIHVMGDNPGGMPHCECNIHPFFILYTDYFSIDAPVRCGQCFNPVSLYKLPKLDESGYENLLNWQYTYQALDQLFISSGIGESFALSQLTGIRSQLTKDGVFLCEELAEKTGAECYYYLLQYSENEDSMTSSKECPSCKKHWILEKTIFSKFRSMCKTCHLISN